MSVLTHRATIRQQHRLERIYAYVDANLSDPDLSPPAAARALGMSVRSLHLTIAPTGQTFGKIVMRRRLQTCYARFVHPDHNASICATIFDCGFNNLSSFYRAFRERFGACPRQLAAAACHPAVERGQASLA